MNTSSIAQERISKTSSTINNNAQTPRSSKEEVEASVATKLFKHTLEALIEAEFENFSASQKTSTNTPKYIKRKIGFELGKVLIQTPRDARNTFRSKILRRQQFFYGDYFAHIASLSFQQSSTRKQVLSTLYGESIADDFLEQIETSLKKQFAHAMTTLIEAECPLLYFGCLDFDIPLVAIPQEPKRAGLFSRFFAKHHAPVFFLTADAQVEKITVGYCLSSHGEMNFELLGLWRGDQKTKIQWVDVCKQIKVRGLEKIEYALVDESAGLMGAVVKAFPFTRGVLFNCYRSNPQQKVATQPLSLSDLNQEAAVERKEKVLLADLPESERIAIDNAVPPKTIEASSEANKELATQAPQANMEERSETKETETHKIKELEEVIPQCHGLPVLPESSSAIEALSAAAAIVTDLAAELPLPAVTCSLTPAPEIEKNLPVSNTIITPDAEVRPLKEIEENISLTTKPAELNKETIPPFASPYKEERVLPKESGFQELKHKRGHFSYAIAFLVLITLGYTTFKQWGSAMSRNQTPIATPSSESSLAASDNQISDRELMLVLALTGETRELLLDAIKKASERRSDDFTALLASLANHRDPIVRIAILKALHSEAHRGTPFTIAVSLKLLEDKDFLVRAFAAKKLSEVNAVEVKDALRIRLTQETHPVVREVLINSL